MTHKVEHRVVAIGVFLASFVVYLATMAPTVVFWDVGEFIAAAKMLQVPHPPGSPLFLLFTRLAVMVPFLGDVAARAHAFTAFCAAAAIMFTYLIMVRIIINFRGTPSASWEKIVVYAAAGIGALSLAFGNTVWNNSIESEVYGMSTLFLAAVIWLALRWLEREGRGGNEKYVLFMAYLIGLSLGVHLLALLAIFPVLMIMYFRRYEVTWTTLWKFAAVAVLVFVIVYPGIVKVLPGMMDGTWGGTTSDVIAYIPWILIVAVMYGVYSTYEKRQRTLHIALLAMMLVFIGYTTYTTVIIRSNANPPMNENSPKDLAGLTAYLGREQYGDAPLWPRRYSQEPQHQGIYTNYTSEMDFLWRYQLHHMFTRYVLWNYAGSEGDWQDARSNLFPFNGVLNAITGVVQGTTPFAGEAKDSLFAIPLLLGLFGVWYHFKKDRKMAWAFLVMFLIMGPILTLYQAQQDPQPRERDYFYVGAYMAFSIWIAVGLIGIVDLLRERLKETTTLPVLASGILGLGVLTVPVNMLRVGWETHDRSGNYVAWDYSYNILQTVEKNAIIFTNGDNDTFPLWYLQDVERVRRDVRIVNLSLVNTSWYIQQMKDEPYYPEAEAVPISLSDDQIARIQPMAWEPTPMTLPVPPEVFQRYGTTDTALIRRGGLDFTMNHTFQVGPTRAIKVQDIMVRDILFTNNWKYPVYFAVTVAPDSKIGLDSYLWFHGLAWRLEPRRTTAQDAAIDPAIVEQNLFNEPEGFSTTPQYGYKFRGIADPDVYYDENTSKLMINYRSAFIRLALYRANVEKDNARAAAALDRMEAVIPRAKIPMGWELQSDIASFYQRIGRQDTFEEMAAEIEPALQQIIAAGTYNINSYYNPFRVLLDIYEIRGDRGKSLEVLRGLQVHYPNDPNLKQRIAAIEAEIKALQTPGTKDTAS